MAEQLWQARIFVTLKPVVNDPQGLAIRGGLQQMGYAGVESVRAGKFLVIKLRAPNREAARAQVGEMCNKLLANPVIEDFSFTVIKNPRTRKVKERKESV